MPRALSIHVGVNCSQERFAGRPLRHSEDAAWQMAELANRAGYPSVQVLRGAAATREGVTGAVAAAAGALAAGDTLFLSFSGHGSCERDDDGDDGDGWDETWCLHDGILPDDELAKLWRLFAPGVRVLVVAESCFGGGSFRKGCGGTAARRSALRGAPVQPYATDAPPASCIAEAAHDAYGIAASLLVISAAGEEQTAQDGLFTRELMHVWNGGAFRGSFCDLHREVRDRVLSRGRHEPQIMMLGAPDPGFPLEPAFHLNLPAMRRPPPAARVFR